MDFKILKLKLKNEIIECIYYNYVKGVNIVQLLRGKSIDQILEIEQNTNNDSLEPFPKNFDFIKIDLCDEIFYYTSDLDRAIRYVLRLLIPDDYVYKLETKYICYINKNIGDIGDIYKVTFRRKPSCYYNITYNNNNITLEERFEVCDFIVSKLPCFVHIDDIFLTKLQESCNVIPIGQFDRLYYLKPTGLLTKAAIKK